MSAGWAAASAEKPTLLIKLSPTGVHRLTGPSTVPCPEEGKPAKAVFTLLQNVYGLPKGYRSSEKPKQNDRIVASHAEITGPESREIINALGAKISGRMARYTWRTAPFEARNEAAAFAANEQSVALRSVMSGLRSAEKYVAAATPKPCGVGSRVDPTPKWVVEFHKVQVGDSQVIFPTLHTEWQVVIDLQHLKMEGECDVFSASFEKAPPVKDAGSEGDEGKGVKAATNTASNSAEQPNTTHGAANAGSEGASIAGIGTLLGLPVGDLSRVTSRTVDLGAGVAFTRRGGEGLAGFIANFYPVSAETKALDIHRAGVFAGTTLGATKSASIGLSYRVGDNAYLFGGRAFGGGRQDTFVFGLMVSVNKVVAAAAGGRTEEGAKECRASVKIEQPEELTGPEPMISGGYAVIWVRTEKSATTVIDPGQNSVIDTGSSKLQDRANAYPFPGNRKYVARLYVKITKGEQAALSLKTGDKEYKLNVEKGRAYFVDGDIGRMMEP
jgi:hypothetical protein